MRRQPFRGGRAVVYDPRTMDTDYGIHSEPRAGHWVAWATSGGDARPAGEVLLVGQTQEEAEANAARWIERLVREPGLLRAAPAAEADRAPAS